VKLPAIQFYPGDWRKDPGIQALSFEERGIWLEILFLMHESKERGKLLLNGKKIPNDRLAKMLGADEKRLAAAISTIVDLGIADVCSETGALISRRMVRDEALIQTRRDSGKKGGNPNLTGKVNHQDNPEVKGMVNQGDNHVVNHPPNQTPTPSASSSTSASAITHTPPTPVEDPPGGRPGERPTLEQFTKECAKYFIPDWYAKEKWQDWESKGWMSGKTPVVWREVVRNWTVRDYQNAGRPLQPAKPKGAARQPAQIGTHTPGDDKLQ